MEEYKPNSNRSKEPPQQESIPEKRVDKVIIGSAKSRKKSGFRELTDEFLSNDVGSVKSYVLMDVLIPAIKKAISDIVTNGIDMLLYGESAGKKGTSGASKISYRSYYDRQREHSDKPALRAKPNYGFDDVVFDSRGDAESVLMGLDEQVAHFGVASVGDLYELAGVKGSYTDNKYGWSDLEGAMPVRVRDGYIIKLPKAMLLD